MLHIVCIHGNANYSQSEKLHFQFFFGVGACPQTPYGAKNLFPHCMPVKFLGNANLPFFIPAGLTALPMGVRNIDIDLYNVAHILQTEERTIILCISCASGKKGVQ